MGNTRLVEQPDRWLGAEAQVRRPDANWPRRASRSGPRPFPTTWTAVIALLTGILAGTAVTMLAYRYLPKPK